jgi:predicted regulator of Ras-like GTPase activity (Roadblock/LC7/MglB family)
MLNRSARILEVVVAKLDLVMFKEEYEQLQEIISRLQLDASSKVVFLVDKNGQQIASAGDVRSIDATSLASLTAGNVAATDGLAKLIGEKEFSLLFHEGEKDNLHISIVGKRGILVVIFDINSSLALVRLRVKKAGRELQEIFERVEQRAQVESSDASKFESPFSEITDEDIDRLFGD